MPDDRRVLEGIDRLVVDGTNVLHALRRSPDPAPPAALIGRLRAIVPPGVAVVVVLDGSPEHGLVSRRVASGVEVRYAGRWTADEVITRLAEHELGPAVGSLLVVTDDIALAAAVRRAGGRTVRNGWLIDRLGRQRLSAPSVGRPMVSPPDASRGSQGSDRSGPDSDGEADAARWSPGRGATRKRGNPRRRPSTGR
jgi:hypothetical protein